jgi:hypothetical protein
MNYRFVHLSSSGAALQSEEWSCASDTEALHRAQSQVPSFGAELWRGDRRLSTFAGPLSAARESARETA